MDGLPELKCSRPTWVVPRVPKHNEPCSEHQEALCGVWTGLCADWYNIIIHIHSSERRLCIWGHVRIYGIGIYQNSSQRLCNEIALKPPKLINHDTGMDPTYGSTSHRALPEYFWRENNHGFSSLFNESSPDQELRPVSSQDSRRERSQTGHTLLFFSSPRAWALPQQLTHPAALGNRKPISSFGLPPALYYQVDPCKCISPMEEVKPPREQGTGGGCLCLAGEGPGSAAGHSGWHWDEASRGGYGRAEPTSVHGWTAQVSWKAEDSYTKAH